MRYYHIWDAIWLECAYQTWRAPAFADIYVNRRVFVRRLKSLLGAI